MALVDINQQDQSVTPVEPAQLQQDTAVPSEQPLSGLEKRQLITRAAEQNNWLVSLMHNGIGDFSKSDPNFNAADYIKDSDYINYPEYFVNTDNQQEVSDAMRKVDEYKQYQELAQRAPSLAFWSSMAWGFADPMLAVPGFGAVRLAKAGNIAVRTAALTGGITGGIVAGEEAVLHMSQPRRTLEESAINTAVSAVVGSAFGGIVGGLAARESRLAAQEGMKKVFEAVDDSIPVSTTHLDTMKNTLDNTEYQSHVDMATQFDNVTEDTIKPTVAPGAIQEVSDNEIAAALQTSEVTQDGTLPTYMTHDARIAGMPNWAIKSTSVPGFMPASLEGMSSSSGIVRDFTSRIFNMHYPLEYNLGVAGKASPASLESKTTLDMLETIDFTHQLDDAYKRYLHIDPESVGSAAKAFVKSKGSEYLSAKQFDEEVMRALNYGGRHEIPEVQQAASYTRNILNKAAESLNKLGYDIQPDENYFRRVYDIPAIMKDRMGFENMLVKNFVNRHKAEVVYKSGDRQYTTPAIYDAKTKTTDFIPKKGQEIVEVKVQAPISMQEAKAQAVETTDNILKLGDKSLALGDIDRLNFEINSDSMKPRTLNLDYNTVAPYLIKNFRDLMHQYLASTSRMKNYRELLNDMGWNKIQDGRTAIRDEFNNYMEQIKRHPTLSQKKKDKMIASLSKQSIKSEKLFNDITAISLGQYKKRTSADPFWRMTTQYNASRLLGGVVLTSLSDPTTMFIKQSVPDVLWNGWISELKRMMTFTNKLKKQDFRDAMSAIQQELDDGVRYLMNPDFGTTVSRGGIERTANAAGQVGMKVNLMQYWNNIWQRASHSLAESRMLRSFNKGWDNISMREKEYFREGGIDEGDFKRIVEMQKKYGEDIRGTHVSNSRMWSDREAARKFNTLILLEVRKSPLMTERGDIPIWFQKSDARRAMFLFKGFSSAATSKILVSALSRRDHRALTGVIALVMAGALGYVIRQKFYGRDVDWSIPNLISKGIDRSGVLGLLADPFFQVKYAAESAKKYGKDAWLTEPLSYIMGPNGQALNTAYAAIMKGATGTMDKKTEYQLRSLIPWQNLFYWQGGKK